MSSNEQQEGIPLGKQAVYDQDLYGGQDGKGLRRMAIDNEDADDDTHEDAL